MAYVTVEDLLSTMEVVVFPSVLERCRELLGDDQLIIVTGRVNLRDEQPNVIVADEITELHRGGTGAAPLGGSGPLKKVKKVEPGLYLRSRDAQRAQIMTVLAPYPGKTPVILASLDSGKALKTPQSYYVEPEQALLDELRTLLGTGNVCLVTP